MMDYSHLLAVAAAYADACGIEEKTVSSRVFGDGKRLTAVRVHHAELTVGRFNAAMRWFSDNWPDGASWPDGVDRPASPQPGTLEAAE